MEVEDEVVDDFYEEKVVIKPENVFSVPLSAIKEEKLDIVELPNTDISYFPSLSNVKIEVKDESEDFAATLETIVPQIKNDDNEEVEPLLLDLANIKSEYEGNALLNTELLHETCDLPSLKSEVETSSAYLDKPGTSKKVLNKSGVKKKTKYECPVCFKSWTYIDVVPRKTMSWRTKKYLNDEELLRAAEEAADELYGLSLDNALVTDEEYSEEEETNMLEENLNMERESELILDDETEEAETVFDTDAKQSTSEKKDKDETDSEEDVGNTNSEKPKRKNKRKKQIRGKGKNNNKKSKSQEETEKRKWKKKEITTSIPEYNLRETPTEQHFQGCNTYSDFFLQFFDPAIIKSIVYQSNLYATQRGKVLNLKEEELLAFIGLNFFMGYHRLPSYKNYWSTQDDLGIPVVRQTMNKNRFDQILSHLHVNDNYTIPEGNKDKIFKIRPLVTGLNGRFDMLDSGSRELAVDESMILFKGRSSLKQYNPKKPIKRGFKLWCIADKKGYVKKFTVYQGKDEVTEERFKGYGLGEKVVLSLSESYWGHNRKLYFDNYFTSVLLLEKLKNEKTLACGTVLRDRLGLPKDLTDDKTMKRGDLDYRVSNLDLTFFKWFDNRVVHFLSNYHGTESTEVSRLQKDGSKKQVTCPAVVKDYNIFMGGVDHADRLRQAYCVDRRSKKWWHRLFFGILDIAFVNSYIVYKKMHPEETKTTLLEFRRGVSLGLMSQTSVTLSNKRRSKDVQNKQNCPKRRRYNYSISNDVRLGNRGVHFPVFVPNRGRCEQCSSMAVQSKPRSKCSHCRVYLCVNEKKIVS